MDSLIRIYLKKDREAEQSVRIDVPVKKMIDKSIKVVIDDLLYSKEVYDNAFGILNQLQLGVFSVSKISGYIISLKRLKSGNCLQSGTCHDSDNAYLYIGAGKSEYIVEFGCHRKCAGSKRKRIGTISVPDLTAHISRSLGGSSGTRILPESTIGLDL